MIATTPLILRAVTAHTRKGGQMPARTAEIERSGRRYIVLWNAADEILGVYRVRRGGKGEDVLVRLKKDKVPPK